MYREVTHNGKYRYVQSFKDKDGKSRRVSIVKNNKTRATEKEAFEELQEKINKILNPVQEYHNIGYYKQKFLEFKKTTTSFHTFKAYKVILKKIDDNEEIKNISKIKYDRKLMEMREELSANSIKTICIIFNLFFTFIKKYYISDFDVKLEFRLTKEDRATDLQKIKY